jgi:hypothetical protein
MKFRWFAETIKVLGNWIQLDINPNVNKSATPLLNQRPGITRSVEMLFTKAD